MYMEVPVLYYKCFMFTLHELRVYFAMINVPSLESYKKTIAKKKKMSPKK